MTITVRMNSETEKLLDKLARSKRYNKSRVVREAIQLLAEREKAVRNVSVYERVKDLVGVIDSGGRNLSQDAHRKVSQLIRNKHAGSH